MHSHTQKKYIYIAVSSISPRIITDRHPQEPDRLLDIGVSPVLVMHAPPDILEGIHAAKIRKLLDTKRRFHRIYAFNLPLCVVLRLSNAVHIPTTNKINPQCRACLRPPPLPCLRKLINSLFFIVDGLPQIRFFFLVAALRSCETLCFSKGLCGICLYLTADNYLCQFFNGLPSPRAAAFLDTPPAGPSVDSPSQTTAL
jgi:hypothetical protein